MVKANKNGIRSNVNVYEKAKASLKKSSWTVMNSLDSLLDGDFVFDFVWIIYVLIF